MVQRRGSRWGFTLIELLVVIAIIAVLIGLLLPAVQKVREAANRTQCQNNLKQMGLAIQNYDDVYHGLPPSRMGPQHGTWAVAILPYMEQVNLYQLWNVQLPYYQQAANVVQTGVKSYFCPARRMPPQLSNNNATGDVPPGGGAPYPGSLGDYACVSGNLQAAPIDSPSNRGAIVEGNWQMGPGNICEFCQSRTRLASITDGTSNTLLLGEKHVPLPVWGQSQGEGDGSIYNGTYPRSYARVAGPGLPGEGPFPLGQGPHDMSAFYHCRFGSYHTGICQFVFADGHVYALSNSTDTNVLMLLSVMNDGQPIPNY